jgi:glutathionyl-hydroquinone reductase
MYFCASHAFQQVALLRDVMYAVYIDALRICLCLLIQHYFTSHEKLNTYAVIPRGPGIDFAGPHDRERFV